MQVFEYGEKGKEGQKARALDVLSLLETMAELEAFNGTTKEKIVDNYYEVKRQLRDALIVEAKPEEKKEDKQA